MKMFCSGLSEPGWQVLRRRDLERQAQVAAAEAATAAAQAATATAETATAAAQAAEAATLARCLHAEGQWLAMKSHAEAAEAATATALDELNRIRDAIHDRAARYASVTPSTPPELLRHLR